MKHPATRLRTARCLGGFSLVEVTLALGVMAFSLVGVLGVLPLAMNSGRQSFDQARASAIANTVLANIRGQAFSDIHYLDNQFDNLTGLPVTGAGGTLNLNTLGVKSTPTNVASTTPASDTRTFYAKFPEVAVTVQNDDASGASSRLSFTGTVPVGGADYKVTMYFNNQPDGTIVPSSADPSRIGQANRITLVVSGVSPNSSATPRDSYRFATTVANRMN